LRLRGGNQEEPVTDFTRDTATSLHDIAWGDEELYWRGEYVRRPYVRADRGFAHYEAAFRYGAAAARAYRGRSWKDVEAELAAGWQRVRGNTEAAWEEIKGAVRDAWERAATRHGSS
jgi:hypothetical protein